MTDTNGIFTISLDFELYWGMRDKTTMENYADNIEGVPTAIDEILKSFDTHNIHATWATVGFIFYENIEALKENFPDTLPKYDNDHFNPYSYIHKSATLDKKYHFSPESIRKISDRENQEIATHTMSHYYCHEKGQSKEEFFDDLKKAQETIKNRTNQETYSLVFPRNQWKDAYLSVLKELGILCYRGNETSWIYKAVNQEDENKLRRAIRLLDSYMNISGHNTHSIKSLLSSDKLFNIPSSRFLRPVSKKLSLFEGIRLKRIKDSMTYAAKNRELFHLWWHPHNFGKDVNANILFLNEILEHYKDLQKTYKMASLNMQEVAHLLLKGRDQ